MRNLYHLSTFSGIGGLDLAAERAGFCTVGQCEWADYPTKILEKHWPTIPRWRDIRTLTGESFYERTGMRTVDVISGGFPCQPFSTAGKRRGAEDDRYLWPELLRVIQEIRPAWFVGENVAGIVTMALDTVLSDLENIGYTAQPFIVPACAVDAPHRRDRCAIVAYSKEQGNGGLSIQPGQTRPPGFDADGRGAIMAYTKGQGLAHSKREGKEGQSGFECCGETLSDTKSDGLQGFGTAREQERGTRLEKGESERRCHVRDGEGWPVEPGVGRVADGIPHRVDRIKCLGNAVVPAQFYPIFKAIADTERSEKGTSNAEI